MTNHSSSAYQVVVIAVRKEYQIEELLKGHMDHYSIRNFEKVSGEGIEELEEQYKIEISSLLDTHNIYQSYSSSADEHGFYEGDLGDYSEYGSGEDALMNYWDKWMDEEARIINKIKRIVKDKVTILYHDQDVG